MLVGSIIDTAEWREGKAQQFPDDVRNAHSAQRLRWLATAVDQASLRDSRLKCLWLAEHGVELDDDESDLVGEAQNRAKSELIRGFGFHDDASDEPVTPLEAFAFLDQLLKVLKNAAQPGTPAPPNGKAQAFETLDEALAWFRPGTLTTELLRHLGRMEPEFIE